MAKTVFYARVSTRDQNPSLQIDAAKQLGLKSENIFVEKASGSRNDPPVLARALAACEKGDTLACYKLDRIGRSLAHLTKLLADLEARGVHFRTVEDGLDTRGSTGKLVLHMLGAVAQFERDLIIERTRAGLAAARKRGRRCVLRSNGKPTWRARRRCSSTRVISTVGAAPTVTSLWMRRSFGWCDEPSAGD